MKKLFKQITCLLLALFLCAGMILTHPAPAAAAANDEYTTLYQSSSLENSVAGVERTYSFTTKTTGALYVDLYFQQPTAFSFQLTSSSGTVHDSGSVTETDQNWLSLSEEASSYVYEISYKSAAVGTFNFCITTFVDTAYALIIDQGKPAPSLSNTKMSITAGFTDTLKVQNSSGKIKWSSNNSKIASVDAKGVVSAKKKGSCTITAETEDGKKLKCKIKVRNNVYTKTKGSNANAESNNVTAYIYKASLDKSGNLVCKFRVINNTSRTVKSLADMRIDVQNENGKTVYSYQIKSKNVNVPSYKYKDYTITVPKSKVKKCDLVKATIRFTGDYIS